MSTAKASKVVLDASAVMRILGGYAQAAAMHKSLLAADLVLAPELMLTEVANDLWCLQRAGQLEAYGLQRHLSKAADLIDHIERDRIIQAEALALATNLDNPVYDCLHHVLARREVATPLTADKKLLDLASKVLP
jgi:predicted nucleic acid-binding protein